jgi:hypothetical protein
MADMNQVMVARQKICDMLKSAITRYHAACGEGHGYAWLATACHKRIGQLEDAYERLDRRICLAVPASGEEVE